MRYLCYIGYVSGALNIRNFPEDLHWACTVLAATRRQGLREFVIEVLRRETADVRLATVATAEADPTATQGRRRKKPDTTG